MPEFTPDQIDKRIQDDPDMQHLAKNDETEFLSRHAQIYKEFGYKPDGSPLRMAQKVIGKVSRATGIPEGAVQFGTAAILPTVGTMAGMAVGASGGPLGAALGASGGSVLGEAVNSLLGVTEPMDSADFALAAGAPLLGPAVAKAGPVSIAALKRVIPGAGAGLNELAGEALATKLGSMRVTKEHVAFTRSMLSSAPDFKLAAPNTRAIFNQETADAARQALQGVPGKDTYLKALNNVLGKNPDIQKGSVSFKDLMTLEQGFNSIKGGAPNEVWGAAAGKIIDDIEAAANDPKLTAATASKAKQGLDAFKTFIATNRKHHLDEKLVTMFTPGSGAGRVVKPTTGDPNLVLFDQKAFKNLLDNDKDLKRAFSPTEIESIRDSVSSLGYISRPPSQSADALNLAKRYGAGGMAGWMAGGPVGAVVGATLEEILRKAVTSEPGRKAVKHLAKEGRGHIDALELHRMLGQITAGASAGIVAGVSGMGDTQQRSIPLEQ